MGNGFNERKHFFVILVNLFEIVRISLILNLLKIYRLLSFTHNNNIIQFDRKRLLVRDLDKLKSSVNK